MESTATERLHMARALALAARGLYTATPNPRVGCVIVRDGDVIGEGWHLRAGEPHAEVNALADARARGADPRGATLFVTLEPCNRYGRTPPCVDAIAAAGIARVVMAMRDPNPEQERGAERLRSVGVDVDVGLMETEARELNIGFVSRMTRGRPWVRAKLAASLDGRTALANGRSQWITGPEARADGHAWRARACAILTGVGTVMQDDPAMTVRAVETPRQPLRVVVDRHGQTPASARVLADNNALLVTAGERNPAWPGELQVLTLPDVNGRVDLAGLLKTLATRGINELHVEAGAKLSGALLDAGLIDELLLYLAPALIGDPARGMFDRATPLTRLAARSGLTWHGIERCGDDLRVIARVNEHTIPGGGA
ncbi:MAG TPA: bifunctional diaminohydroxyphosphoribosylaminopyrimidine deaminase/5-amino-6-(5-phosphoribosylamino)uracil reductase RibD [Casimicrobiaceae bacterium]|nr:bifunctional diaminohydroxyphosphoribosylaminopyrimidine deaminase/5-amino-6-(5-phosphoribosylamino)uracil reductase RibD [Casimicrobiaceae bacterium]